jgi:hypothetical protein
MPIPENCRLLHGPYLPPPLRRGDRTACLARDCDVVVTGTSTGRIPWPRCRAFGTHGGGSGILLDDELARAVRCESALAIRHWWGVSTRTVAWWRRALGVTLTTNERSRQLRHAAAKSGAAAMRERGLTDEEADERSERAERLNLGQYLAPYQVKHVWKEERIRLVGTQPGAEVARMLGLSVHAVRLKRTRLGILTRKRRRSHPFQVT